MTFSYSGDPSDSDLDELRFRLGDTVSPGLLWDEEITYLLGQAAGDLDAAMILSVNAILVRLSLRPEREQVGDTEVTWGDLRKRYVLLAEDLSPLTAGVSWSPSASDRPAIFSVGMNDNRESAQ